MLRALFFLAGSLVALAAARGNSQCTSGEILCCSKVLNAFAVPNLQPVTGISSAAAADIGLVGSTCTKLTVIGGGRACATKALPLCCTDDNYNGTLSLGCSHINSALV